MFNLIFGDCKEKIKEIPDESIDLILTDPPYGLGVADWDSDVLDDYLAQEFFRVAKNSCSLYLWCSVGEKSQSLIRWFQLFSNNRWYFKDMIVWKKQRGLGTKKGWLFTREEILWFVKDNKQFIWNKEYQYSNEKRIHNNFGFSTWKSGYRPKSLFKRITNVWTDIGEVTFDSKRKTKIHYTPKPIKALERIILLHTKEGDIVFDPFMGTGSTGIACKNLNRSFIGIEINESYFNLAKELIFGG